MKQLAAIIMSTFLIGAIVSVVYLILEGQIIQGISVLLSIITLTSIMLVFTMIKKINKNTELTIEAIAAIIEVISTERAESEICEPGLGKVWLADSVFKMPEEEQVSLNEDVNTEQYYCMSIAELNLEEEKAVKEQDYEKAAMLRNLIIEKEKA